MKKRVFAAALALCLLTGLIPSAALAAAPPAEHTHCSCGGKDGVHIRHTLGNTGTYTAWEQSGSMPEVTYQERKRYYLTQDVTLSEAWLIPSTSQIYLCLNGHSINLNGYSIRLEGSLWLCDCSSGVITQGYLDSSADLSAHTIASARLWRPGAVTDPSTQEACPLEGGVIYGGGSGAISSGGTGAGLQMFGGNLAGNHGYQYAREVDTAFGGAINAINCGSFFLYGGTLTGNAGFGSNRLDSKGGAVYVYRGSFEMAGGLIRKNSAYEGGAVYVESPDSYLQDSRFTLRGGSITDNNSDGEDGAAVHVGTTTVNSPTGRSAVLSMYSGEISNNRGHGVMLYGPGKLTLSNPSSDSLQPPVIAGNDGDGVYVRATSGINDATVISGGSITGNKGFGVRNQGHTKISGGSITGNTGGGVCTYNKDGSFTLSGSPVIKGNTKDGKPCTLYVNSRFGYYFTDFTIAIDGELTGTFGLYLEYLPEGSTTKPVTVYADDEETAQEWMTHFFNERAAEKACEFFITEYEGQYGVWMREAPEHVHAWDEANWVSDSEHHWHECTAEGCTVTDHAQKDGYGAHTGSPCTVCGYTPPPVHAHEIGVFDRVLTGPGTFTQNGNYYLTGDLDLGSEEIVIDNASVEICLNGHTISHSGGEGSSAIRVKNDGSLVLEDCAGTGCIRSGGQSAVSVEDDGQYGSHFAMKGGSLICTAGHGLSFQGGPRPSGDGTEYIGGEADIRGGYIQGALSGIYALGGIVTVAGGEIRGGVEEAGPAEDAEGLQAGIYSAADWLIIQNEASVSSDKWIGLYLIPAGKVQLSGGTYAGPENAVAIAEGIDLGGPELTYDSILNSGGYKYWDADGNQVTGDENRKAAKFLRVAVGAAPSHTHDWSPVWKSDETGHWHDCLTAGCPVTDKEQKNGYGPHSYSGESDTTCNLCGYTRALSHDITGTVTDSGDIPVPHAAVKLRQGMTVLKSAVTDANGRYTLKDVKKGVYNIVAEGGGKTVTSLVEMGTGNVTKNLQMPGEHVNSILEVKESGSGGAAQVNRITVGNLDETAEAVKQEEADADAVTITMTVEEKQAADIRSESAAIQAQAEGKKLEFLSVSVTKTVERDGDTDTSNLYETPKTIQIVIPYDFSGKNTDSLAVYRFHDGQAEALNRGTGAEGTFQVDTAGGLIHVFARKFSVYAIGYTPKTTRPEEPGTSEKPAEPSGGSGNKSDEKSDKETTYAPAVKETEHGTVKVNPRRPERGDKVTVTLLPHEGYQAAGVTVTDRSGKAVPVTDNGDRTYTFIQPSGSVIIQAGFEPLQGESPCPRDRNCPISAFSDASPTAWYHDGVHDCLEKGLMSGYDASHFGPNGVTSRAMVVTMLWRLEGCPAAGGAAPFTDVAADAWCAEAIRWAVSQGVAGGYDDGAFRPNAPVTREQLAAMLYRYAQYKGGGFKGTWSFRLNFDDAGQASQWAYEALCWMFVNGIIGGIDSHTLAPKGQATRAQTAAVFQRFCERS